MNTKVLHVINGELYAGAERVQDLLAEHLPAYGYTVEFAALKQGIFAENRKTTSAPLHPITMRNRFDTGAARRLAGLVRQGGHQLLHAHTPRSLLIARAAASQTGVPVVYHVHGPTVRDTEHRVRNYINAAVERLCAGNIDLALPVSRHAEEYALGIGIPPGIIRIVPNGVPAGQGRLMQSSDVFTVGSAALFRPRKGLEVLVEAFARLRSDWDGPARLRLIGGFETHAYRSAIEARANRLGVAEAIDWVGHTRDVYRELAGLSAFVLPSLYGEGMPMVILEAMANGLPVVASSAGGIGEIIDDGVNGLLCTPGDSAGMASQLHKLAADESLRARLGTAAKQQHAAHYSADIMARRVAHEYDRLLGNTEID